MPRHSLSRLCVLVILGVPALSYAKASPKADSIYGAWTAYSTTARSITSNVTLSPTQLKFQNGAQATLTVAPGSSDRAAVFKMSNMPRALKNGNKLCGTYLAATTYQKMLMLYESDKPIRLQDVTSDPIKMLKIPGICGSYTYSR